MRPLQKQRSERSSGRVHLPAAWGNILKYKYLRVVGVTVAAP